MTRTPLSRSKGQRSRSPGRFTHRGLNASGQAGAVVTARTYWAWETTATLRLFGGARGAGTPAGGGEGRGHIVSPRAQLVYFVA